MCNAHHLRELTRAFEQDGQQWANKLKNLLETISRKVTDAGVVHWMPGESQKYRHRYRAILKQGEIECPEPIKPKKGLRGRVRQNPETCWNG